MFRVIVAVTSYTSRKPELEVEMRFQPCLLFKWPGGHCGGFGVPGDAAALSCDAGEKEQLRSHCTITLDTLESSGNRFVSCWLGFLFYFSWLCDGQNINSFLKVPKNSFKPQNGCSSLEAITLIGRKLWVCWCLLRLPQTNPMTYLCLWVAHTA